LQIINAPVEDAKTISTQEFDDDEKSTSFKPMLRKVK